MDYWGHWSRMLGCMYCNVASPFHTFGSVRDSDFAIPFVDENDYSEISAKAVSAKPKLKRIALSLLYRANSRAGKSLTH